MSVSGDRVQVAVRSTASIAALSLDESASGLPGSSSSSLRSRASASHLRRLRRRPAWNGSILASSGQAAP